MAYTTATFTRLDQNGQGTVTIILTYTGNAGETPVEVAYPFDNPTGVTANYMRGLAMARLATLNANRNFYAGALPNVGVVLDTTTPLPAPPASTFGSFVAVTSPFTPGATPQDVFTITGSATRRVDVTKMMITTVQTTAGFNIWSIVKRSAANVGGASSAVAGVPTDKAFPAATATVLQYTSNPTTFGTLVGGMWTGRIAAPTATALPSFDAEKSVFNGSGIARPITLTGVNDVLAWNFGAQTLPPGLSVQASVWWTEN